MGSASAAASEMNSQKKQQVTTMSKEPSRVRIIGVDPGSRKAGWGIIDVDLSSRKFKHVDNGVIFLDTGAELAERLVELSEGFHRVIEKYRPSVAAVEDVFVQKSARSALVLGQARGACLATLGLCHVQVRSHTPSQVKLRVTSRGRATKEQVAHMVCLTLGLAEHPFEDAADALAVALCHGVEMTSVMAPTNLPSRKKQSVKGRRAGLEALARAQGKI